MADGEQGGDFFDKVGAERRDFFKMLVAGGAFAAPLVASFSIDEVSLGMSEAYAQSNMSNMCANMTFEPDPGYVGPRRFAAYAWTTSTRVNGLVKLIYDEHRRRPEIRTSLRLSPGATIDDAWIEIDGQRVATLDAPKDRIKESSLEICMADLTALVEAMAAERAVIVITGSRASQAFVLSGAIHPEIW
ncbi:MAG: hypothetical protein FJ027_09330 [Candidatus Rokubacteria bacterium]|nr:hypothetical protein [Candidatus Rokubacteria bacterium]